MTNEYGIETVESNINLIRKTNTYSLESFKRITTAFKCLSAVGYISCENPDYMKRGNQYAHYLRSCGKIIFETFGQ